MTPHSALKEGKRCSSGQSDIAMPTTHRGSNTLDYDPMSAVWSSIRETVAVAFHMVGWKWEYSGASATPSKKPFSRKRSSSPGRSSWSSSCALESLDSLDLSDSDCSEESEAETLARLARRGLGKQYCEKQD
ncbi:hypothetical protein VOLCADRAFT_97679 [Volvox carteri f. nagariensis]|uniref:Uncharacterized protein n=1 Tax=Volvox carteri f. nagariensis TaxID=3068 RepID=D8UDD0_VOLCA|nr:uncharacterized protein VOLCADRAFT_97679 [Volvox carteri f. nagariensis]EFJ42289.1 hypothetical protein VOLCADRAFT_97679 [Volvox carteri f. nagariensis]|eukprot:XP_002956687.1 hypothetical protein VOLCADRAFT_97679 [Volvox carteri f. nagariensis]